MFHFLSVAAFYEPDLISRQQYIAINNCLNIGSDTVEDHICLWYSRAENLAERAAKDGEGSSYDEYSTVGLR